MCPKLIGFYQSNDQAAHARDDLRNAGFAGDHIHIYQPAANAASVKDPVDRKLYQEAARRGATAVMLDLDETEAAHEALEILKRHHPVQMARAAWPAHPWQGSMQPQRPEAPSQPQPDSAAAEQPEAQPQPPPPAPHPEPQATPIVFSAKRFAAEIAGDERFRGREWSDIEPFVHKEFEKHYPNESWDDHCPAIMLGYLRSGEPT